MSMKFKKFDETDKHRLISSAIGGTAATAAGHPFDSVKVRMQTSGQQNAWIFRTMYDMWKAEGIRPFMRGIIPPMTGKFVATAFFFTLNGWFKDNIIAYKLSKEIQKSGGANHYRQDLQLNKKQPIILSLTTIFAVGGTCGFLLSPILSFAELVKIQLQIDKVFKHNAGHMIEDFGKNKKLTPASVAHSYARQADMMFGLMNLGGKSSAHNSQSKIVAHGRYSGVFDCAMTIIRRGAVTRGSLACSMRLIPGWGAYMWSYEVWNRSFDSKNTIGNNKPLSSLTSSLRVIVGGAFAGCFAWATSYPFDYVKTQLQAHPIEKWNVFHTYQRSTRPLRIRDVVRDTYTQFGLRGFYRGFVPCLYRSVPVNLTQFWVYESVFQFLQERAETGRNNVRYD